MGKDGHHLPGVGKKVYDSSSTTGMPALRKMPEKSFRDGMKPTSSAGGYSHAATGKSDAMGKTTKQKGDFKAKVQGQFPAPKGDKDMGYAAPQPARVYQKAPGITAAGFSAPTGTAFHLKEALKGLDYKIDKSLGLDKHAVPDGSGWDDPMLITRPTKNFYVDVDPSNDNADPAGQPWATADNGGHGIPHNPGGILNVGKTKNFSRVKAYLGLEGTETSAGIEPGRQGALGGKMKAGRAPFHKTSDKGGY